VGWHRQVSCSANSLHSWLLYVTGQRGGEEVPHSTQSKVKTRGTESPLPYSITTLYSSVIRSRLIGNDTSDHAIFQGFFDPSNGMGLDLA